MIEFLEGQGAEVLEALRVRPSLEEIFVKITGLELSEMNNGNQKKAGGL
jgi:ABC-2 type transport system ATP-binding protein